MKKYAFLMLVITAVVLMSADVVSARDPQSWNTDTSSSTQPGYSSSTQPGYSSSSQTTTGQPSAKSAGSHWSKHGATQSTTSTQKANQVRNKAQKQYNKVFTSDWCATHRDAWNNAKPGSNMWQTIAVWPVFAEWIGLDADSPDDYDVFYEEDTYYVDDEPIPADQYIADLIELALEGETAATTSSGDWMPVGVFALSAPGSTNTPNRLFQFAVNKNGKLAGSCYDAFSGKVAPITGSIDKEKQRAVWTCGGNKATVMETQLGSFVQDQSTVIIHQGKGNTEKMTMVRLGGPKTEPWTKKKTMTTPSGSRSSYNQ